MMTVTDLHEQTRGRWPQIFSALSIPVPANPKQHGPCPVCGGKDRFRFDDKDGRGTWFCNVCVPHAGDGLALVQRVRGGTFPETMELVGGVLGVSSPNGHATRTIVATYDYTDEAGNLLFQVVRSSPKGFRQRRPDGQGGWIWNLQGIEPVLYRLPAVVNASSVLVVEGEKDVDTAYRLGLPDGWAATCNPMGAGKWRDSYTDTLRGKQVVILPDADEPGLKHAAHVAQALHAHAATVGQLTLNDGFKDLSDWAVTYTVGDFHALLESVTQWGEAGTEPALTTFTPQGDEPPAVDWPQDPPIALEAPVLPAFPSDVLPPWLNDMAQSVASHTETPVELPVLIGLGVLAACCQRTFVIQPKSGYREPLNLWTVVALESGNRKTSVMQHMTKPLRDKERELCEAAKSEMQRIETERENIKARVKNLRGRLASGEAEDCEPIEREIHTLERSLPDAPTLPRLWAQDITPEKLGQALAENGERLSIVSDEGGIFDIMGGRYSNGVPNLDVYLQSHAGGVVRVDRGNRPPVMMNHPALTIALSPQPDVLRGLTEKPGFRSRGLLARFLYALPASPLGYRTLHNIPIPPAVESAYRAQLLSLLNMQPPCNEFGETVPFILRMTDESYQEWHAFAREVETKMRDDGPYEHIRDWAGKLPGAAARLAGLFHCAKHAQGQPWTVEVELETVQMALALTAILTSHALVAFDMMGADPALGTARKVWRWVQAGHRRTFTARDCFQALRSTFPSMDELDPAFEVLLDRAYVHELPDPKLGQGRRGRRSRVLIVNPTLMEGWS